jgi:hypothetical protein
MALLWCSIPQLYLRPFIATWLRKRWVAHDGDGEAWIGIWSCGVVKRRYGAKRYIRVIFSHGVASYFVRLRKKMRYE